LPALGRAKLSLRWCSTSFDCWGEEGKGKKAHFQVSAENSPETVLPVSTERVKYHICCGTVSLRNSSQHPGQQERHPSFNTQRECCNWGVSLLGNKTNSL